MKGVYWPGWCGESVGGGGATKSFRKSLSQCQTHRKENECRT